MRLKQRLPKRMRSYLREQTACCKPSTVSGYRGILGCFYRHLKTISPKNPVAGLTREGLQDYLSSLCERNLVPYTKVNYLLAVRKYLRWDVERGGLKEKLLDVLDRSRLPPVPEYLPRPLSSENDLDLQKILRESDDPHAPSFLLLRQTGLRISELINLPKDCVLSGAKNEKYLKVPLGKMNTERLVPLCEESLTLIERIRSSRMGTHPDRLIGMRGSVSKVYNRLSLHFKTLVGDMTDQGKPVTFHRLRHSFATTLLTGGVSLVSLMKLLGHRRIEMTLRYAKVTPSHLRDEYLKAVQVLEGQSLSRPHETSHHTDRELHPAALLEQLRWFLVKTSTIPHPQQKNILRRLYRLQLDLDPISFPQKIKLDLSGDGGMVRLTG